MCQPSGSSSATRTPTTPGTCRSRRSPAGYPYAAGAAQCYSQASTGSKPPRTSHQRHRSSSSPTDTATSCASGANTPSSYPKPHDCRSPHADRSSAYAEKPAPGLGPCPWAQQHPGVAPGRAIFTTALSAARDQVIQANGGIAESVVDLVGTIGRHVLNNLLL